MSLEIKVEPEAVKSLTEEARLVPTERIESVLEKLEELDGTLSSWKGDSKPAYDSLHTEVKDTLTNTKNLMNAILAALDKSVDDFSNIDEEISEKFESAVEIYTAD